MGERARSRASSGRFVDAIEESDRAPFELASDRFVRREHELFDRAGAREARRRRTASVTGRRPRSRPLRASRGRSRRASCAPCVEHIRARFHRCRAPRDFGFGLLRSVENRLRVLVSEQAFSASYHRASELGARDVPVRGRPRGSPTSVRRRRPALRLASSEEGLRQHRNATAGEIDAVPRSIASESSAVRADECERRRSRRVEAERFRPCARRRPRRRSHFASTGSIVSVRSCAGRHGWPERVFDGGTLRFPVSRRAGSAMEFRARGTPLRSRRQRSGAAEHSVRTPRPRCSSRVLDDVAGDDVPAGTSSIRAVVKRPTYRRASRARHGAAPAFDEAADELVCARSMIFRTRPLRRPRRERARPRRARGRRASRAGCRPAERHRRPPSSATAIARPPRPACTRAVAPVPVDRQAPRPGLFGAHDLAACFERVERTLERTRVADVVEQAIDEKVFSLSTAEDREDPFRQRAVRSGAAALFRGQTNTGG